MLILFGLLDLTMLGWIVRFSIHSGISPDVIGFRRDREPVAFWISLSVPMLLAIGVLAVLLDGLL